MRVLREQGIFELLDRGALAPSTNAATVS
jgi:hypothetical protein